MDRAERATNRCGVHAPCVTNRRLRVATDRKEVAKSERHLLLMRLGCGEYALRWLLYSVCFVDASRDGEVAVGERVDAVIQQVALVVVSAEATFLNL